MAGKGNTIAWKVVRRNRWGHRWIEEPEEREAFRERCRHRDRFGGCAKGCYTMAASQNSRGIIDAVVPGCTPGVEACGRLSAWDRRHGLQKPYTIVENRKPRNGDMDKEAKERPLPGRYTEKVLVGGNVTDIMRLPCVRSAHKRSAGDREVAYYILEAQAMADGEHLQYAHPGEWLSKDEDGKWHVTKE